MRGEKLRLTEPQPGDRRQVDCVEIYLPKRLEFLSELYRLLREKVTNRLGQVVLDGFSSYEVDGVFLGERLWQERTLVIRLLFIRTANKPANFIAATIQDLGREIASRVAAEEEEIWICHYPQNLFIFTGLKRLLT